MMLRKMNIDSEFIIAQGQKVPLDKRIGFYRWMIQVCKARD